MNKTKIINWAFFSFLAFAFITQLYWSLKLNFATGEFGESLHKVASGGATYLSYSFFIGLALHLILNHKLNRVKHGIDKGDPEQMFKGMLLGLFVLAICVLCQILRTYRPEFAFAGRDVLFQVFKFKMSIGITAAMFVMFTWHRVMEFMQYCREPNEYIRI